MRAAWQPPAEPVVYRVYDGAGRLIYIGSTADLSGRFDFHRRLTWWFELIDTITFDDHPTLAAARAAEAVAIQEEQPAFNVYHTGRYGPLVTAADIAVARRYAGDRPWTVRWLNGASPYYLATPAA